MTTQTMTAFLYGPNGGRKFSATCTDTALTEITSTTGTLSLYKVLLGKQITHYMSEFAAGIGRIQVRNTDTNEIKAIGISDVIGEMIYRKFDRPFTVERNDILEGYCDVAT